MVRGINKDAALGWGRRAAVGAGLGMAGVYAYGAGKFRRTAAVGFDLPDAASPESVEFARVIEGLTGAPVRPGNRVRILRNGSQTFPALERHFLDDLDASVEFGLERWRNRPLAKRVGEYAGELVRQSF